MNRYVWGSIVFSINIVGVKVLRHRKLRIERVFFYPSNVHNNGTIERRCTRHNMYAL